MAALEGEHTSRPAYIGTPHITADLDAYAIDYWPPHESGVAHNVPIAAISVELPVSQHVRAVPGQRATSYSDDFYHRVHLLPGRVALGNVLSEQVLEVEVWNAHLVPQQLSEIVETATEGLDLAAPADPPTTFGPNESRVYDLSVSLDGPPDIAATFAFAFPAETPTLAVTGSRIVTFAVPINWRDGLQERWAWLTDVIVARDGTEQRRNLRRVGRRSLAFTITAERLETAALDTLLWGWHNRPYAVPLWTDATLLTAPLPSGSTAIPAVTELMGYEPGGLAIVVGAAGAAESVEVVSVEADHITLLRPTLQAWPSGSHVAPAVIAWLDEEVRASWPSAGVAELPVAFRVTPNTAPPAPGQLVEHYGRDVFLIPPNRAEPATRTWTRKSQALDGQAGLFRWDQEGAQALPVREWLLSFHTRAEIEAFRRWAYHRRGAWRSFWAPAWERTLELLEPIASGATAVRIRSVQYESFLRLQPGRRDLALLVQDGTWFLRRITGGVTDGTTDVLTIDQTLGVTVELDDVVLLTWLEPVRLAEDELELRWHSSSVADARVAVKVVR